MRKPAFIAATVLMLFAAAVVTAGGSGSVKPKKEVCCPSPSLSVSGDIDNTEAWEDAFDDVYRTLLMNLHGPNWYFNTRYAYPSPTFRGAYLWDTAFISQVWKPWDPATAEAINRAVLDHAENGRLNHYTGPWGTSENTQPPVMTWSVWENYLWSNDKDNLESAYKVLKDYNNWYYENRRLDTGLFFWIHPYESGIDNTPRFGSKDESEVADMPNLAAIDVNSYIVRQNETLAKMAEELGRPDEAKLYRKKADELAALVNELMWDEDSGYYYDLETKTGELVKIRTIASLFPLFAGIPDKGRAEIVLSHVMDPSEFNTDIPLPSVARDEEEFEKDCWRGPVWTNTAYMVIVGMERYGYNEDAAELSWKLVDGIYRTHQNTGDLVEFYDPDRHDFKELSRKKGNLYKQITLGGKPRPNFVGWTGLANTIVIEHLVGFKKDKGAIMLTPNFPNTAEGASFTVEVPAEGVTIEVKAGEGGSTSGTVTFEDGTVKGFDLKRGESVEL